MSELYKSLLSDKHSVVPLYTLSTVGNGKIEGESKNTSGINNPQISVCKNLNLKLDALKLAAELLQLNDVAKIGFFGLEDDFLIKSFEGSEKALILFDPETNSLNKYSSSANFSSLNLKVARSVEELLSEKPDLLIINSQTKELHPEHFQNLEKLNSYLRPEAKAFNNAKPKGRLKVLFQARNNILTARGGDTVAMVESAKELIKLGVEVEIDPFSNLNPADFDLVHLFNFSTPDVLEPLAKKALAANTPYVVTTFYEDRSSFYDKMSIYGRVLEEYFDGSLTGAPFDEVGKVIENNLGTFPDKELVDNHFVAEFASCLLASGESEKSLLLNDYPETKRVEITPFGSELLPQTSSRLFEEKYGIKDYILCVARIEWRKNQGMLMKAMEESDLPIVLVKGDVPSQPWYEERVPYFKRRGRNLTVKNLSPQELASAYHGALVHVLPSWYELPGLVTLEAAICGTPVVGTRMGALPDYLGEDISYCDPGSVDSIKRAIFQAANIPKSSPRLKELKAIAESFTWKNSAEKILDVYLSVLESSRTQIALNI